MLQRYSSLLPSDLTEHAVKLSRSSHTARSIASVAINHGKEAAKMWLELK
jgi:hypothetical protein